jgi:peptidoglycan/xylan/chitin deacetylase (PgdA/CDA1 family)
MSKLLWPAFRFGLASLDPQPGQTRDMSRKKTSLFGTALSVLHYTKVDRLLAPLTRGQGVIFMLHHVRPGQPAEFEPNRILAVTPEFLESVIEHVKAQGFDCVSLDEAAQRLAEGNERRPFACFTLDDGYRDNRDYAYPVFKRHNVPFAVYVPSAFAEGEGDLWWLTLEAIVARASQITLDMNGSEQTFLTETVEAKIAAFEKIYWWLRELPERKARDVVAKLATAQRYDASQTCRDLVMSWDELRAFSTDPLVTIGAHTVNHFALAKLSEDEAREEIQQGVERIEQKLGRPCRHFSFPYGDERSAGTREFRLAKDLGFRTAVTTRKGLIHRDHAGTLTALPRFSLNGDFQDVRFVKVMLSGLPFALWNGVARLQARRAAAF